MNEALKFSLIVLSMVSVACLIGLVAAVLVNLDTKGVF